MVSTRVCQSRVRTLVLLLFLYDLLGDILALLPVDSCPLRLLAYISIMLVHDQCLRQLGISEILVLRKREYQAIVLLRILSTDEIRFHQRVLCGWR